MIKKDKDGNQTFYVYGSGLIGEESKGIYRTYHFYRRGSTTAITDETGAVTDRFEYAPYGELVNRTLSIEKILVKFILLKITGIGPNKLICTITPIGAGAS